jgi:hypothetical protein
MSRRLVILPANAAERKEQITLAVLAQLRGAGFKEGTYDKEHKERVFTRHNSPDFMISAVAGTLRHNNKTWSYDDYTDCISYLSRIYGGSVLN